MKRNRAWMLTGLALSAVGVLSGCNTSGTGQTNSPSPTGSNASNQVVNGSNSTSTSTPSPTPSTSLVGWSYINLSAFGKGAQIAGLSTTGNQLEVTAMRSVVTGNTLTSVYMSAPLHQSSSTVGATHSTNQPSSYNGPWSLKFGKLHYTKPIQITLTDHGSSAFTLPPSVPGYASEIMTDPAPFDNQVIGQSGHWVWLAMKGPLHAPLPYMMVGFRYWNRIVAVNTQTDVLRVFSIPRDTSRVSTANNAPAFAERGQYVYIGTGPWLGVLPANPTSTTVPVVRPEPKAVALKDQQDMLAGLQREVQAGAQGVAAFWNGYVMKGDQKDSAWAWQMQPTVWNHGSLPSSVNWATRFPLQIGTSAYQTRAKLYTEIKMLLNNSLNSASIALDTSAKLKQHYHAVPPAPVPGYTIQGGYYVKNSATGG
ncbi:hypothetical protein [Alicyclobacillus sp. ALC3]|uniref:hypothetical protein n=1 Tax=Alicyclobacillus sp. ALC3 TaxID=2796143 RepID=UPI0023793BB3|nr:hypothetical protein [Alicyclobacillus sp. ALC3]WDL98579.1 hypothetical protein JC200_07880 [Alicyclobacillus sp. ALC3]